MRVAPLWYGHWCLTNHAVPALDEEVEAKMIMTTSRHGWPTVRIWIGKWMCFARYSSTQSWPNLRLPALP